MIAKCTCQHKGQDGLHGEHMRVWNAHKRKDGVTQLRCTVCGRERETMSHDKDKKAAA